MANHNSVYYYSYDTTRLFYKRFGIGLVYYLSHLTHYSNLATT